MGAYQGTWTTFQTQDNTAEHFTLGAALCRIRSERQIDHNFEAAGNFAYRLKHIITGQTILC